MQTGMPSCSATANSQRSRPLLVLFLRALRHCKRCLRHVSLLHQQQCSLLLHKVLLRMPHPQATVDQCPKSSIKLAPKVMVYRHISETCLGQRSAMAVVEPASGLLSMFSGVSDVILTYANHATIHVGHLQLLLQRKPQQAHMSSPDHHLQPAKSYPFRILARK